MPIPTLGSVSTGDYYEVDLRGRLFGQRILNTFKFRVKAPPTVDTDRWIFYSTLVDTIEELPGLVLSFLDCLSSDYILEDIRVQCRAPERLIYREFLRNNPGTIESPCLTPNIAVSIERRTEVVGRSGVGRVQLGGIPSAKILEGEIINDYYLVLLDFAGRLYQDLEPADGSIVEPVLWHEPLTPDVPTGARAVVGAKVYKTVRDMRRRQVGLGE